MNIYRINSTAFSEEDFHLMTTLTRKQISSVIRPIVNRERKSDVFYDNEMLVSALKRRYPEHVIEMYVEFETITI